MARKSAKKPVPFRLDGALDIQNAASLQARLVEHIGQATPEVTVDLSEVTACDSAGLQLLCAARRSVLSSSREWRLVNPSAAVLGACTDVSLSPENIGV